MKEIKDRIYLDAYKAEKNGRYRTDDLKIETREEFVELLIAACLFVRNDPDDLDRSKRSGELGIFFETPNKENVRNLTFLKARYETENYNVEYTIHVSIYNIQIIDIKYIREEKTTHESIEVEFNTISPVAFDRMSIYNEFRVVTTVDGKRAFGRTYTSICRAAHHQDMFNILYDMLKGILLLSETNELEHYRRTRVMRAKLARRD
jgi:hypothetical protein